MIEKISIIVPVYNVEEYLPRCMDSLVNQTYRNIEIICVNDGATDNSVDVLQAYAEKDNRIIIVNKENGGLSSARNEAHKYVTGEYIMYIDSDDWIEPDTCEVALSEALSGNADVVFWNYLREFVGVSKEKIIFDREKIVFSESDISGLHRRFLGLYGKELSRPENADSVVTAWGKLYKASIILENKFEYVDTKIIGTEDALFNLYVFGKVKRAVYLPYCFNHYRKDNVTSLTKRYKHAFKGQWDTLHKYMREYIEETNCDDTFSVALYNRISLSIIGLGMNILRADASLNKVKAIKEIISAQEYREAAENLTLKYFPIHWKVFFFLAKYNCAFGVYLMLLCIKKLKGS